MVYVEVPCQLSWFPITVQKHARYYELEWVMLYVYLLIKSENCYFPLLFFSQISSYAHSLFTAVLLSLIQKIFHSFLFQTQWSGSWNHLIVAKQSLYGRNVNCEIFSDEKNPEQGSRSVAQNFKLLSKLTETLVAVWCATTADWSVQYAAVFVFVICWKAFLTGEFISSPETSWRSGGTSQRHQINTWKE